MARRLPLPPLYKSRRGCKLRPAPGSGPGTFLIREDQGTFVVTFRTRQLGAGDTVEGRCASYKIQKFIGTEPFAELYEADVIGVSTSSSRLHPRQ
jgi:hypothetical protein